MKLRDFYEYVNSYNIVMLTETKLDEYDQMDIPNFVVISKVRKYKKRAWGGATILVRSSIINEIQQLEVNCDDYSTIWIKISK